MCYFYHFAIYVHFNVAIMGKPSGKPKERKPNTLEKGKLEDSKSTETKPNETKASEPSAPAKPMVEEGEAKIDDDKFNSSVDKKAPSLVNIPSKDVQGRQNIIFIT